MDNPERGLDLPILSPMTVNHVPASRDEHSPLMGCFSSQLPPGISSNIMSGLDPTNPKSDDAVNLYNLLNQNEGLHDKHVWRRMEVAGILVCALLIVWARLHSDTGPQSRGLVLPHAQDSAAAGCGVSSDTPALPAEPQGDMRGGGRATG